MGLHRLKLVLLGEGRVGKTSLLARFIHDSFNAEQNATVQATFVSKKVQIDGDEVELNIWDTAGQERFHSLGPIYYRDAHAALLVFDITDADSFERAKNWVKELRMMVGPDIALTLAANKQDLEGDRAVPDADSRSFAQLIGAGYATTSAKTGEGLTQAFLETARRAVVAQKSKTAASKASGAGLGTRKQGTIVVADDVPQAPKRASSCC
eukprot:jgi/Botrbrau1/4285/Bobra.0390s0025.1